MSFSLRFFNNHAPVLGRTLEGSVSQILKGLKGNDLSQVAKVIVTQAPTKQEVRDLTLVMSEHPQIKMLSLAQTQNMSDESHEALALKLRHLHSLTHLWLDGTKLASRVEDEKQGLLFVAQEAGKTNGLKHLALKSHQPSAGPSDYQPLSEQCANTLGIAFAESRSLVSIDMHPFWLGNLAMQQFLHQLQTVTRPCPVIEFNNIKVTSANIQSLLESAKRGPEKQSEMQAVFASQRPIGFKN